jgi:RNA polymerase sigma-70 factor (ECF subfamily)
MPAFLKRFQKQRKVSEWILVQQVKLGDREAFGKLYQLYLDKIYRFIYFRVDQQKELAEDIAADVFVKAWSKIETFKKQTKGSFQAWLYMIARNTVIDTYREAKKSVRLEEYIPDEKANHEEKILFALEIDEAKNAIKKLTQEQQDVLILKFVNDVSNKEIATILGKREDAIRALQYRALKELREILEVK